MGRDKSQNNLRSCYLVSLNQFSEHFAPFSQKYLSQHSLKGLQLRQIFSSSIFIGFILIRKSTTLICIFVTLLLFCNFNANLNSIEKTGQQNDPSLIKSLLIM